jgi:hypothetical protein
VFGINYPPGSYRPQMPMVGFFQGSQLSLSLRGKVPFGRIPLVQPVLIEITDGATPRKVHEENLLHNTAAALYDFVRFDLQEHEAADHETKIIRDMQLVERFDRYLSEHHYGWWAVVYDWMQENLSDPLIKEFNNRLGTGRVFYGLATHVPVWCSNGSLWKYKVSNFDHCPSFLTRVRVPRWPGSLRRLLIRYTTEAPLVVTNTSGLRQVLDFCTTWFLKVETAMKLTDAKTKERWPIESAFYRAVILKYSRDYPASRLRSDLDNFW